jgi:UPF0755 protein
MIRSFSAWLVALLIIGGIGSSLYLRRTLAEREAAVKAIAQAQRADITVTIPEGWRREEIGRLLEQKGVCTYTEFVLASKDSEGKLFPDTYRFFPKTDAEQVVRSMVTTFNRRISDLTLDATPKPLSGLDDVITLSSIVEREAATDAERPLIAAVYLNRMEIGMKLDADPTVQFAKIAPAIPNNNPPASFSFWPVITRQDYQQVDSAYNLYRNVGLPPGPIANPGIKSVAAVLQPANHDYFYFFHRNGTLFLSKTLAEHEAKIAAGS